MVGALASPFPRSPFAPRGGTSSTQNTEGREPQRLALVRLGRGPPASPLGSMPTGAAAAIHRGPAAGLQVEWAVIRHTSVACFRDGRRANPRPRESRGRMASGASVHLACARCIAYGFGSLWHAFLSCGREAPGISPVGQFQNQG